MRKRIHLLLLQPFDPTLPFNYRLLSRWQDHIYYATLYAGMDF
ncbi:MAG: hypothetical protein QX189_04955 [Methylococcales bacterium]